MKVPGRYTNPLTAFLVCLIALVSGCNWVTLVSKSYLDEPTDGWAIEPGVSADGRYVAFASQATNLVEGDTNGYRDVFVRDVKNGVIERVSVSSDGEQGNSSSSDPSLSADGRFVAFESWASNLVDDDTNDSIDVFVHDRLNGTTRRISVDSQGNEGDDDSEDASISHDGRFIAFYSLATNFFDSGGYDAWQIYVHDLDAGRTDMVSVNDEGVPGNWSAVSSDISGNGRYVAFESYANNLTPGDSSTSLDIFVRDLVAGTTERVSVDSEGNVPSGTLGNSFEPAISDDGRYVVFESRATYLVEGDTNGKTDILVRDRVEGTTTRVSLGENGVQANADTLAPDISGDGRFVVFQSGADNLVEGDVNLEVDIFLHDQATGTTSRFSVDANGLEADDSSYEPAISADGRYVVYRSEASNLGDHDGSFHAHIVLAAVDEMTALSVSPDTLPIGKTTSVEISGAGFRPGATPVLEGAQVSNVVIVDENTISADMAVATDTPEGLGNVSVVLPGTGPGALAGSMATCTDCVTFIRLNCGCGCPR